MRVKFFHKSENLGTSFVSKILRDEQMMGTHIFKIVYILVNLNIVVTTLELKYHR